MRVRDKQTRVEQGDCIRWRQMFADATARSRAGQPRAVWGSCSSSTTHDPSVDSHTMFHDTATPETSRRYQRARERARIGWDIFGMIFWDG